MAGSLIYWDFNMRNIFHEVHLTVKHKIMFEQDCKSLNVKPIIIDMGPNIPTHSMTSSTYENKSDSEVYTSALNLKNKLENLGYEVQRLKIETVPWHEQGYNPNPNQYFEAHFSIEGEISNEDLKKLNLHKSKNLLKKDNELIQMLTYRVFSVDNLLFNMQVDTLITQLEYLNITVNKTIREFAIYDSNRSLDDNWLKG